MAKETIIATRSVYVDGEGTYAKGQPRAVAAVKAKQLVGTSGWEKSTKAKIEAWKKKQARIMGADNAALVPKAKVEPESGAPNLVDPEAFARLQNDLADANELNSTLKRFRDLVAEKDAELAAEVTKIMTDEVDEAKKIAAEAATEAAKKTKTKTGKAAKGAAGSDHPSMIG